MQAEHDWSDEPILGRKPADASASEEPYLSSGSMYGAGDWHQGGISAQKQGNCQVTAPDDVCCSRDLVSEQEYAAQPPASAVQGQPMLYAANLSSAPLLPQGSNLRASDASQSSSAAADINRPPHAAAACNLDGYNSSALSQPDSCTPLHSGTSASSAYTNAASLVSKACSSPPRPDSTSRTQAPSNPFPAQLAKEPPRLPAGQPAYDGRSQMGLTRDLPVAAAYQVHLCKAISNLLPSSLFVGCASNHCWTFLHVTVDIVVWCVQDESDAQAASSVIVERSGNLPLAQPRSVLY